MNTILITGGTGFIGANLSQRLLFDGHHVIAVDNFITSDRSKLALLEQYKNFYFYNFDITQPLQTNPPWSKQIHFDKIYHLACPTGVPNLIPMAEEMLLACSIGTRNILELAKQHNSPVLFTSSSEIYGDPLIFPQTEDYTGNVDPLGTRSAYEEGKRFSESLIAMYVHKYGLDAKIVRLFNIYGPGMSLSESRIVPRFLSQAINNKPLTVQGDGKQTRTLCYIDDLIKGLSSVMLSGTPGEAYNLGSDIEYQIIDVAQLIIKLTNSRSTIEFVERPAHDHQGRRPSLKKAKKLGWQPQVPLCNGLQLMISDLKKNSLLPPSEPSSVQSK